MDLRLDGKVALVTGASRGIGFAIAKEMAASGASVMLSSRKPDALASACERIDGEAAWFAANAGEIDQAEACVAATLQQFGGIDVLVNNAATNPYMGPMLDIDESRFDKTVRVNWWGPLAWSKLAVEQSMGERGGSIINIASIGGMGVEPSIGVYNGTKAAVLHLTRTLAVELSPDIRVNAIAPGLVKTDMARALWETHEEAMAARMPLERLGEPHDIAQSAVFLASDAASWITGQTMVVDGGATLGF